jgi:hypothetical protein
MTLEFNPHFAVHVVTIEGAAHHNVQLGESASGNVTRIMNAVDGLEDKVAKAEEDLRNCANQVKLAQAELARPFEQEDELNEKSARLAQLNLELNIDNHSSAFDDEDELSLSEDEEYDYRAELADCGLDEAELFSRDHRSRSETDDVVAEIGGELAEQGKKDALREEIEAGAVIDVEGTLIRETQEGETEVVTELDDDNQAPRTTRGDVVLIGLPAVIDPAEERKAVIAEARRKLAEDGTMPVITDALEGRAYTGEIVEVGTAYAVQKIDEGRGIVHNLKYLRDFKRVLDTSGAPILEISYDKDMVGRVDVGDRQARGRGFGNREEPERRAVGMGR